MKASLVEKIGIYNAFDEKSKLNFPISKVKGIKPDVLKVGTFQDLLTEMQEPDNIKQAEKLKEAYKTNPTLYKQLKEQLNGFVIGEFSKRTDKDCLTYVPLLVFDIDGYEDSILANFDLARLEQNDYVFAAFPSPSQHGLRIFIWADVKPETHKAVYLDICQYLSDFLHISTDKKQKPHIDTSTQNLSRLWFYAPLDSKSLYTNFESLVFVPTTTPQNNDLNKTILKPQTQQDTNITVSDSEIIKACLGMLKTRKIAQGRNHEIFALACLLNEHGLSKIAVLEHCLTYVELDFDEKEVKKTVESALKRSTHAKFSPSQIKHFIEIKAPQNDVKTVLLTPSVSEPKTENVIEENEGIEDDTDIEDVSRFAKIEAFLQKRYDIQFNTVARELEIKQKDKTDFSHLDDFWFNDLLRAISKKNIKVSDKTLAVSLYSSFTPQYNPFEFYFNSLPKWNETDTDHIEHLASFVKSKDPYWFKVQFKKALIRAVACSIGALPFNKHCLTFQGKQHDGKTTFIRFLCPPQLQNYMKESFKVDKDGLIALCQNFIINLDELDTISKQDTDQIKAVFTTDLVKERLPYARTPVKFKRTASFFGSTNKMDFLTDETGNVRWLIIEIDGIDFNYTKEVDINAVWSQAYMLLLSGFNFQMTADELKESEKKNQKFKRVYAELELLQEHFEPSDKDAPEAEFKTATQLLKTVTNTTSIKLNQQLFSKALRELGFEKIVKRNDKNVPTHGYFIIEKK
jgi:predicted P-loop ATPase